MTRRSRVRGAAVVALVVIVAIVWPAIRNRYPREARGRVERILHAMSSEDLGPPVGIWAANRRVLGGYELWWAWDHFRMWRLEKELDHRLESWRIVDVDNVPDAQVPTVIVTVNIEGRELRMLVPENRPISWKD